MTRLFVAGFQHETNTFSPDGADWDAFTRGDFFPPYREGAALLEPGRYAGLPLGGFLDSAHRDDIGIVPSCWAGAAPSGPVRRSAFERIERRILDDLAQALEAGVVGGVYLDLHGAAVAEHTDTPETGLVQAVRALVGARTPIVVSLDSHANVDPGLLALADHATCYRSYPHVDMAETGSRAFELLLARCAGAARPQVFHRRIPFLIPILSQSTLAGPGAAVRAVLEQLIEDSGAECNYATGFPAADVPHCGPCVWGYGEAGRAAADALFQRIVAMRPAWRLAPNGDDGAVVGRALALAESAAGPIVVCDPQDNPGAGTSGSTTGILHALVQARAGAAWPGQVVLGLLHDPLAARRARDAGVGAELDLSLGSAVDTWNGRSPESLVGRCVVRALHEGPVRLSGPMMHGAAVDPGPSALVEHDGILVAVCSAKIQLIDRALLAAFGIEATAMRLICVKSAVHFRADFEGIAAATLVAKSPGQMAIDPADLPWRRLDPAVARAC